MKLVFLALWLSTAAVTWGSPSVTDLPVGSLVERAAALARDLEVLCSHSIFMEFAKRKTRLTRVVWQAKGQTEAAAQLRRIYLAEPILQAKSYRFWPQSLPPMDLKARCFLAGPHGPLGQRPVSGGDPEALPEPRGACRRSDQLPSRRARGAVPGPGGPVPFGIGGRVGPCGAGGHVPHERDVQQRQSAPHPASFEERLSDRSAATPTGLHCSALLTPTPTGPHCSALLTPTPTGPVYQKLLTAYRQHAQWLEHNRTAREVDIRCVAVR
jgi:hypothetical protein